MAETEKKLPPVPKRNWRDIAQSGGHRRTSTGIARRRKLLVAGRWVGLVLLVAGALTGSGYAFYAASTGEPALATSTTVLKKISFRTDGVLDSRWFATVCELRPGDPMKRVDIHRVKDQMERHGQVREATVTICLPDELRIEVRERTPVLRARVARPGGGEQDLLIARDGTVYQGAGYSANTLAALPFLGGVNLQQEDGRIAPVDGIDTLAALLDAGRTHWPAGYAGWRVVSCDRFHGADDPGSVIKVATRYAGEIVFAPDNFTTQVERLAQVVLREAKADKPRPIVRIDLSLPGQAFVEFKDDGRASRKRHSGA